MKRSQQKIITTHSKILRHLRISKGLSMRGAATEIGVSDSTINHVEKGRMDITEKIISRFLKVYEFDRKDYNDYLSGKKEIPIDYAMECQFLIKHMEPEKLKAIYGLLINF